MHRVLEGNLSHAAERRCPSFLFLFLFLFLSGLFLAYYICPQPLLGLRSPYGIPDSMCRSSWIVAVFPCCKTQNILSVLSATQRMYPKLLASFVHRLETVDRFKYHLGLELARKTLALRFTHHLLLVTAGDHLN